MPKATTVTKSFSDVLNEFEKKHNLKVGTPAEVTGLPTGNLAIDWQSGVGGLPRGRITELYGYESSGKTTTALQTAVQLQQHILEHGTGEHIVYLDFEHALDVKYAEALGLDVGHPSFVPLQPNNLEQGANAALDLIDTGSVPLIVFDSVAAMAPKRLKDGEFDQATIQMHRAKLVSALCQSMLDLIHEHNTAAVFVNHKMESIEMTGRPGLPPKITTPGGRGLKFYASLRLEFDIIGGIKNKIDDVFSGTEVNSLVANRVQVKCTKNKVGVPGRIVELRSRYGRGFDNAWSALQVLVSRKQITKSGSWFIFHPARTPQLMGDANATGFRLHGEPAVLNYADEKPLWRDSLIVAAEKLAAEIQDDVLVDVEDDDDA
jgi:recombination protein RecA